MPFFIIFNVMKFLRIFLIGFFIPLSICSQTLDVDYKKLYTRMEKGEHVPDADFEKLINHYQKVLKDFPDESAELFYYYGTNLYAGGKKDDAIKNLNGAFNYALQAKDTTFRYYVILAFARISKNEGALDKSEEYYVYALPGMAVIHGASSLSYTKIYFEYVSLLVSLKRYKEAKPLLEALEYYFTTLKMETDETYLEVLNGLAIALKREGSYAKSVEKYNKILVGEKMLKNGDTLNHIIVTTNIGQTYTEMGEYNLALGYLQNAKRMIVQYKINDPDQMASLENNLALVYKNMGDYKNAESCFNNSIKLYKNNEGEKEEGYCSALSNKADLLRLLGRREEALKVLQTSLSIREKYHGKISENYANSLSTYGIIAQELEENKIAQEYFEEATRIYEQTVPKTHQSYANSLNNLGACYLLNGDIKKGEAYKLEALKIIESSLGKEHFKYITYLIGMVDVPFMEKNYAKGIAYVTEAKMLAKKKFGVNHELYTRSLTLLGGLKFWDGKYEGAVADYEEAIELKLKNLSEFFYTMNREDQVVYLEELQGEIVQFSNCLFMYAYKQPKTPLGPHFEKYFDFHLNIKSLLNKNTTEFQKKLVQSNNEFVKKNYKNWIALKNSLNELYRSDFTAGEQDSIHGMINSLETELRKAINYTLPEKNTYKSLVAKLKPEEAMIDISWYYHFLTDTNGITRYAALVGKNNSAYPECVFLSHDKKDEQVTVQSYNDRMDKEVLDTLSYDLFFKKLTPALKDVSKLYISTKGDFSRVNFQTLFDPASRSYLIDKIDIVYMPDLSALKNQELNSNNIKEAQLFGNPDFNYDFRKKVNAKPTPKNQPNQLLAKRFGLTAITDLPGTETELNEIEKLMTVNGWKFNSFTREKASEENLRKVKSPKILHIATHGYFLKDIETDDDKFLGYNVNAFKQLADVRSGLILAGAAINTGDSVKVNADKDGLLTSREASLLDLSNTDIVILSACQTGLGVETLNMGVIGLQQAFSNAGAKNLILSLWPVDDNATQLLMVKFYEYWLKDATNQNISSAFKKAQLDVKQKYSHPYYWGAFVLLKN